MSTEEEEEEEEGGEEEEEIEKEEEVEEKEEKEEIEKEEEVEEEEEEEEEEEVEEEEEEEEIEVAPEVFKPTTPCFIEGVTITTFVTVLVANTTFKSTLPTNPSVLKIASSLMRACPLCTSVRYRHIIPELFSSARLRVRIVLLDEKRSVQTVEPKANVIVMLFGLRLGRRLGRGLGRLVG